MAKTNIPASGGGTRPPDDQTTDHQLPGYSETKLWDKKKPLVGVYLGTVNLFDKFLDDHRTGIQVRESSGYVFRVYPNGDLMDQIQLSGVKVGDRVHIDKIASTPTSSGYSFDNYCVLVM